MRVIFVTDLVLWSMGKMKGGEAFFRTIIKYKEMGNEVFLISDVENNQQNDLTDSKHTIIIKPSIWKKWVSFRKIGLFFRYLDHKVATRRFENSIKQIMESNEADETILYAYEIFGVEACKRMASKYKLPIVTRFQGTILIAHPYNMVNCIRYYPHYQALKTVADLIVMTDDGTQGNKTLDTVGNQGRRLFLKNGLELREKSKWEELQRFDRDAFRHALGVADDETMFLTVSRLTGWKRVDRAIMGFYAFHKRGGKGKLMIVGEGDKRESWQKMTVDLGIKEYVSFIGSINHAQVYSYMIAADLFLSFFDLSNVGNPLLEAMTLGKCIVTYDVGDTDTVIQHNKNGILLNEETLKNIGDVLIDLAGNSKERERLGKNAREYAEKHFLTWDERMDIEYQEVLRVLEEKKVKTCGSH